ncbi:MAG: peptide deformylase [Candidatus Paceibacterota bacterium]
MEIVTIDKKKDEKFLKSKTKEINIKKEETKELRKLIKKMRRAMHDADGIGLSANQVGLDKKLFVAQIPDDQGKPKFYAVINPEITQQSKETTMVEEGCLSVPGTFGLVERPERITLEGYTVTGKKLKIKAWGILARVFQHEVDHLNGELFIDKAKDIIKS